MTVRALAHPRVRVRVRSPRPVSAFHGVFRCDAAAPSSTIPLPRAPSPTTPRTSRQTFRSPSRTPPHRFARTARRSRRRRRFFSPAPRTARTPPPPPRLPRVRTPARASPRVSQRPRRRPRIDRLASRRVRSRARRLGFAARRSACPATSSSSTAPRRRRAGVHEHDGGRRLAVHGVGERVAHGDDDGRERIGGGRGDARRERERTTTTTTTTTTRGRGRGRERWWG